MKRIARMIAEGDRMMEAPSKDCLNLKYVRGTYWQESVS